MIFCCYNQEKLKPRLEKYLEALIALGSVGQILEKIEEYYSMRKKVGRGNKFDVGLDEFIVGGNPEKIANMEAVTELEADAKRASRKLKRISALKKRWDDGQRLKDDELYLLQNETAVKTELERIKTELNHRRNVEF